MRLTEVKDIKGETIGTIDRTNEYIGEGCEEDEHVMVILPCGFAHREWRTGKTDQFYIGAAKQMKHANNHNVLRIKVLSERSLGIRGIKAGESLIKILNEKNDNRLTQAVSNCIHSFNAKCNDLEKLEHHRAYFLKFLIADYKKTAMESFIPQNVKTHLSNTLTALYRKRLKKVSK
jgi:hypothetical protein